jgi:hypothetical protein
VSPQTGLSLADHRAMMSGFSSEGYRMASQPNAVKNPILVTWQTQEGVRKFRLWANQVTPGGGTSDSRSPEELRIQGTNYPKSIADFDKDGALDLFLGYDVENDVIVAFDRRWPESWIQKGTKSPSVQLRRQDVATAISQGFCRLVKPTVLFENGRILTMKSALLPAYLLNANALLMENMDLTQAQAVPITSPVPSLKAYCRQRGFSFSSELLARYVAAVATKPFVILAGVSGTGKSKLAELTAEFYSSTLTGGSSFGNTTPETGEAYVILPERGPADPNRFALIPVRPDWIDNQSVLGFVNPITNNYESTASLDLIMRADQALKANNGSASTDRYFMLLDEMNLAKVEHYFSDWLACTESRRIEPDKSIRQQTVPLHRGLGMKAALPTSTGELT